MPVGTCGPLRPFRPSWSCRPCWPCWALRPPRSGWTRRPDQPVRAYRTNIALGPNRTHGPDQPSWPSWPDRTEIALGPNRTHWPGHPYRARIALGACRTCRASRSRRSHGPPCPCRTGVALRPPWALWTCVALRSCGALRACVTLRPFRSLRACVALGPWRALRTFRPCRSWWPGGSRWPLLCHHRGGQGYDKTERQERRNQRPNQSAITNSHESHLPSPADETHQLAAVGGWEAGAGRCVHSTMAVWICQGQCAYPQSHPRLVLAPMHGGSRRYSERPTLRHRHCDQIGTRRGDG